MSSVHRYKLGQISKVTLAFFSMTILFQNCSNQGFDSVNTINPTIAGTVVTPTNPTTPPVPPVTPPTSNPPPTQNPPATDGNLLGCTTAADCKKKEQDAQLILGQTNQTTATNCFADKSSNACLFFKNPVASKGSLFPTVANNSMDLSSYQNFAVNLDPASYEVATGCLKNSTYRIRTDITWTATTVTVNDACFPGLDFKVPYRNDTTFRLAAVMAHHYLNFQKTFMLNWTGHWYSSGKNIEVLSYIAKPSYDNNAAFSGDTATGSGLIFMGGFKTNINPVGALQETALSAEVYLHEAGHGNVFFAANAIEDHTKNIACGSSGKSLCCDTYKGCFRAINEGLADYHALIMFPKNTAIGESLVNNVDGFLEGTLRRNYSKLGALLPQEVYSSPAGTVVDGEIHILGRIWGSIWYEARLAANSQIGARGVRSIDKVFSAHLAALTGDDDFLSACQKSIALANSTDGGLVAAILTAECARRGF